MRRFFPHLLGLVCLAALAGCLLAQMPPPPAGSHLGVYLRNIDADRAATIKLGDPRGVEIMRVEPDSPAASAGLAPGDVLLSYNGEEILSSVQIGRLVSETPAGRKVKVQYWREGKTKTAVVSPVPMQAASSEPSLDAFGGAPNTVAVPANVPRVLIVWDNLALGIECEPIDSQLAEYFGVPSGILVRQIGKGLLGDKSGLKAGDVITGVDTRSVAAPADFISYLRTQNAAPGKTMVVQIVRDHKKRSLSVGLHE